MLTELNAQKNDTAVPEQCPDWGMRAWLIALQRRTQVFASFCAVVQVW